MTRKGEQMKTGKAPQYTTAGLAAVAFTMLIIGIALGGFFYSGDVDLEIGGLIGALATIGAGWLAWRGIQAQIESARVDAAEQQLDRFAIAMRSVLGAFSDIEAPGHTVAD